MNTREKFEEWILGIRKYFQVHKYSIKIKAHLSIYNLNGKATRWWRDLKHTKKYELRELWRSKFRKFFQEKCMSKWFFERKVKEFHELRMGSMTMDAFISIFLDPLHYVP